MRLYIKNMVSYRCKLYVAQELKKLGLKQFYVDLGVVDIYDDITREQQNEIRERLKKAKLELLDNKKQILVEKIKSVIVEMIHQPDETLRVNDSCYISEKLGYEYNYLSNIFSEVKGTTIKKYIIRIKIEKAKELLLFGNLTITEIAYKLHYSSVAHLSSQFKNVTGIPPTLFKQNERTKRKYLEEL
ncbi:MAG: helix-turn-helix domain-containing protein [Balneolaceae bacterium]|nr:MAG: helix-turn-helix domain-containing protein [Balneolaceae bacterium]